MSAQTFEVNDLACGRCGMTTDQCLSLREDCCVGCTHYPEPVDNDVDEVAVARAVAGDLSVSLNRAEFAAAHAQCEAHGMSAAGIAELLGTTRRAVQRWRAGQTNQPYSRKGRTMTDDTIDALLASAQHHAAKRVRAAAAKASDAIQRVRDLLAEDAGKAEARERVERLQRELQEAKAALRGGAARPSGPRAVPNGEPLACRKGCGKTSPNPQGRAAHERFCTHSAVA